MKSKKIYTVSPSEVGKASLPVPMEFYKENPHWKNANLQIEVLSDNTLLVRLVNDREEDDRDDEEKNPLMMRMFLDFLWDEVMKDPSKLVTYTEEMKAEEDKLLEGVTLDWDEECDE